MDYKIHNDEMLSIVSEESLEGKSNGTKMYPKEFQCLSNGTSLCFLWNNLEKTTVFQNISGNIKFHFYE